MKLKELAIEGFGAHRNLHLGRFGEGLSIIYGENGAGKTTTFRILATLLRPTAGTARVYDEDVVRSPFAVRKLIGYMPDHFGVYDDLKVWEYLDFFAGIVTVNVGHCHPHVVAAIRRQAGVAVRVVGGLHLQVPAAYLLVAGNGKELTCKVFVDSSAAVRGPHGPFDGCGCA